MNTTAIGITAWAKAFTGEPRKLNRFLVEPDGTVRVWDSVAHHFTSCHNLSPRAMARIREMAK